MTFLFYIGVTLVVLAVLFVIIVVHEYGHYKTAKLFGVRVDEFGFGYPPKIASLFKRGETTFTLNALPFGGFVKIYGEDAVEGGDTSRALFSKPKWQQAIVLVAGVFMNVVLAWVIFFFLFVTESTAIQGHIPAQYITSNHINIKDITDGSVASEAGLQKGDRIVSIVDTMGSNHTLLSGSEFISFIQSSKGEPLSIGIEREGVMLQKELSPIHDTHAVYAIGMSLQEVRTTDVPFWVSVKYSFTTTGTILRDIFAGLWNLIQNLFGVSLASKAEVSGPVGIIKVIKDAMTYGSDYVLYLTALISLNLGALNILPIPALDGGRLFFILIEKIRGRPVNIKTATIIHSTSFLILVSLMVLVTVFDVMKLFR